MTISEKYEEFKRYVEGSIVKKMMKTLEKRAQGKKLIIDFSDKLSPNAEVGFIDDKAMLVVDKHTIELPPTKNEHFLCRAMFSYKVGEVIDWSIVYEQVTGYYQEIYGKPPNIRENWRVVYDTMLAVNKRFRERFRENLFAWEEKTIKRLR